MNYPDYLVHYNKNHSAKNGQFVSGDGDGDGISNDHKNRKKKSMFSDTARGRALKRGVVASAVVGGVGAAIGTASAFAAVSAGKTFVDVFINDDWSAIDRNPFVKGSHWLLNKIM